MGRSGFEGQGEDWERFLDQREKNAGLQKELDETMLRLEDGHWQKAKAIAEKIEEAIAKAERAGVSMVDAGILATLSITEEEWQKESEKRVQHSIRRNDLAMVADVKARRLNVIASPPRRSEHDEAVALMKIVHAHEKKYPALEWFYHQDNGRATKAQGGRKKAEGTKPGVADYFLPWPIYNWDNKILPVKYCGLHLELKAPGKRLEDNQRAFLLAMRNRGYAGDWADSATKAWAIIESYFEGSYTPSNLT